MKKEIGAYFFDSSLLDDKSDYYLSEAQSLVDALLNTNKYKLKKQKILEKEYKYQEESSESHSKNKMKIVPSQASSSTQNALVAVSNPHHQYSSDSTLKSVSRYKQNCLKSLNKNFKKKRQRTDNGEYLGLTRKIFEKVNTHLKQGLGKRAQMMQETIDEVNSKRFENQGKWLERYLELREEIKDHRIRIIALQKALKKDSNPDDS
jgi:hypothetical protein